MMATFIFVLVGFRFVNAQIPSNSFASTHITIAQANGSVFISGPPSSYRFAFSFQSPLVGANKVFLALSGHRIKTLDSFHIQTNAILSGPANGVLFFSHYGDMVVYKMSFCIIVTAPTPYPSISVESHSNDIIDVVLIPINLSNLTFTNTSSDFPKQTFILTSNLFFSHSDFVVIAYIAFMCNENFLDQVHLNFFSPIVNIGSNNFNLSVLVSHRSRLRFVRTTIIIFDKDIRNTFNKVYLAGYGYSVIHNYYGNPQMSLSFNSPSFPDFFGPSFARNCTLAITRISHQTNGLLKYSLFNFSTAAGSVLSDILDGGTGLCLSRDAFCTADCLLGEFYNNTLEKCDKCIRYILHCLNCSSSTYCFNCGINAYFYPFQTKCLCHRFWVIGGCTNISYCLETDPSTGLCLQCGSNYTLSSNGTSCDCLAGNPAIIGYCTNIVGCLTASLINGSVQCTFCNIAGNFFITNKTCYCNQGYSLIGTQCLAVCGDGIVVSDEQCDDHNTVSGDGCSDNCQIEKYYACQNGSIFHQSDCYYSHPKIKLILLRIYKVPTDNVGIFVFSFIPSLKLMSKVNFSSGVSLTLVPEHQITNITFIGGELLITVSYRQDLEGTSAVLDLTINQRILLIKKFRINFTVKSSTYPLIVFLNNQIDFLQLIMNILVGVTVILFLLGSWAHRMIGVETLFPFLFVYFTLGIQGIGNNQLFAPLSQLRYIANYGQLFSSALGSHSTAVGRLNLRVSFVENNVVISIVLAGGLLSLALIGAYYKMNKREMIKVKKRDEGQKKSNKIIYSRVSSTPLIFIHSSIFLLSRVLLFPFSLGFLPYILITAFLSTNGVTNRLSASSAAFTLLLIGFQAVIIASELMRQTKKSQSRREAAYFLALIVNIIISSALLALCFSYNSLLFMLAGESVCFLLILIAFPPYPSKLHFIGVILNQAVVCIWMGLIIATRLVDVDTDTKRTFQRTVIGMLFGTDFLAAVRIVWQLKCYGSQIGMQKQTNVCQQVKNDSETMKSLIGQIKNGFCAQVMNDGPLKKLRDRHLNQTLLDTFT